MENIIKLASAVFCISTRYGSYLEYTACVDSVNSGIINLSVMACLYTMVLLLLLSIFLSIQPGQGQQFEG